jgi:hypothetical protein
MGGRAGWRRRVCAAGCLAVWAVTLVSACISGTEDGDAPATTSTSSATGVVELEVELGEAVAAPGEGWSLLVELPYGPAEHELGVADTHGGQTAPWGPEYLAPDAESTLWVLDVEKRRVARFSADGDFLDAVEIPGEDVGVQMPFVLDDVFWASGQSPLIIDRDGATRVAPPASPSTEYVGFGYSDGTSTFDGQGRVLVPTRPPDIGSTARLRTPAGTAFEARLRQQDRSVIDIGLPDPGLELSVRFVAEQTGEPVGVVFEVTADSADQISFLVYGTTPSRPDTQLVGYFEVDARTGDVARIGPMRDPSSQADPGSPAHLRVVPGSTTLLLTFVDADAMRVYERDSLARPDDPPSGAGR